MAVHTCPRCELRFELDAEVREHLVLDHRLDPDALRPHLVPSSTSAKDPSRRVVVVIGNHTLQSEALQRRLREVTVGTSTDVHVVVPIGHDGELDIGFWRGRVLAERIVGPDVDVTVDAGLAHPVELVERSVRGDHVDLVLLSTLPSSLSRWLEADVAGRLRHVFGDIPIEVVSAEG
jgi:hypothetical protein